MGVADYINGLVSEPPQVQQIDLGDPNALPYNVGASPGSFLYNRTWLVTFLSLAAGPPAPSTYNSLRTVFEIEKNAFSTANKGKITVYNLNDLSLMRYMKGGTMSLALGYGGIGAPTIPIFTNAAIWRVHHERKGPDIASTFESGEGEKNLQESFFNASFPAGTPVTTVINALIAAMGLVVGPQVAVKPLVYNNGVTFSGSCKDALDLVVKKQLGLQWWINGYTVVIAPSAASAIPGAVLVSVATGLIGTPNYGMGSGGDNVLTFTSLINPFLIPGTPVSLVSNFITALAVVKTAKFEGDTHSNKWTVTCECTPTDPKQLFGLNTQV